MADRFTLCSTSHHAGSLTMPSSGIQNTNCSLCENEGLQVATPDYVRLAHGLTALQRHHLNAIAASEKYPFNASVLEFLVELRLISVRDGQWRLTPDGQHVIEALRSV
jgi:hypothetical protein